MFTKVHHVAYVVEDLDDALAFFGNKFGLVMNDRRVDEQYGYEWATCPVGDFIVEFICPVRPTSKFVQELQKHGGSYLDHVAFGVDDMDAVFNTIKERELGFHSDGPVIAPTGWRVLTLLPNTTMGLKLQLVDLKHPS